jgi:hypothetical protein
MFYPLLSATLASPSYITSSAHVPPLCYQRTAARTSPNKSLMHCYAAQYLGELTASQVTAATSPRHQELINEPSAETTAKPTVTISSTIDQALEVEAPTLHYLLLVHIQSL